MKFVCVYLGASLGNNKLYKEAVINLGIEIADLGYTLVYGGSSLGLMGILANTVKENGGKAIGVITKHLINKEKPLSILDELIVVDSMQDRKKIMQEKSDVFIVMPGGLGTLEEAIETWNAIKIGELNKRIGFLNIDGFFDKLFLFINDCKINGFMTQKNSINPEVCVSVKVLMRQLFSSDSEEPEKNKLLLIN